MIFITTGTSAWDFSRFIRIMDGLALKIDSKIIMQIGQTRYAPRNCEYVRYLNKKELETRYEKSRLIVSHAGVGSILTAIRLHKDIIVFPRRQAYQEHLDDHQLELAKNLEHPLVCAALEEKELENKILSVLNHPHLAGSERLEKQMSLVSNLARYLDSLEDAKKSYGTIL